MITRNTYRRGVGKTVWHFTAQCRFYPDMDKTEASHDPRNGRPKGGTLCDHCQNIEKREKRKKK